MASSEVATCTSIINTMKVNELHLVLQTFEHNYRPTRKAELQQKCRNLLIDPILSSRACQRVREVSRTGNFRPAPYNSFPTPSFRPPPVPSYGGYQQHMPTRPLGYNSYNGFVQPNVNSSVVQLPSKVGGRAENMAITRLPFYDVVEPVLRMSELQCMPGRNGDVRASFSIMIPDKYLPLLSYRSDKPLPRYELQLRMFLFDLDVEQADDFPPKAAVMVNDAVVNLPACIPTNKPNAEIKRLSRPVDITSYIIRNNAAIRQSKIDIEWYSDRRTWAVGVWIVHRLNTEILHERLMTRGPHRSIEETKQKIAQMLSGDDDNIALDQLKVSLICGLLRTRQTFPGRAKGCMHLQTFDIKNYLMMNERRPSWKCPQCNTNAHYDNLVIDDYFMDLLQKTDKDVREVELLPDGSWKVSAVSDDDDSDEDGISTPVDVKPKPTHNAVKTSSAPPADDSIIIIDSDDDGPPPAKKKDPAPVAPSSTSSSRPAKRQRRRSSNSSSESFSSDSDDSRSNEERRRRRKVPRRESPAPKSTPATRRPVDVITLDSSDEEPVRPSNPSGIRSATASVESNGTTSSTSSASSTAPPRSNGNGTDAAPVAVSGGAPRVNGTRNGLNGSRPGLNGLRNDVNAVSRVNLPRGNFHTRVNRDIMLAVTHTLTDFLHNIFVDENDGIPAFNAS